MGINILWRLILLSAIWGASFLFMRVSVPEFGPVPLILIRVSGAALFLLPTLRNASTRSAIKENAGRLLVLSLLNSVIPFCLLAFATLRIEAGFASLLNATTPLFAALVGAALLAQPVTRNQFIGILLGMIGVAIISFDRMSFKQGGSGWAIVAALCAAMSYGLAGHYTRQRLKNIASPTLAVGSMVAATFVLIIPGILLWPTTPISNTGWSCGVTLAIICTAAAYLLYFHIIEHAGALIGATVTFLIPLFAVVWGIVFLDEQVNGPMVSGMLVTLLGTSLAINFFPRRRIG